MEIFDIGHLSTAFAAKSRRWDFWLACRICPLRFAPSSPVSPPHSNVVIPRQPHDLLEPLQTLRDGTVEVALTEGLARGPENRDVFRARCQSGLHSLVKDTARGKYYQAKFVNFRAGNLYNQRRNGSVPGQEIYPVSAWPGYGT